MTEMYKIHEDFDIYFSTFGNTLQTRITRLSGLTFDQDDPFILVEPGRTLLIGDLDEELTKLINRFGRSTLNAQTATSGRPGGVFSQRAYDALRMHLFGNENKTDMSAPRMKAREKKEIVFRDMPVV